MNGYAPKGLIVRNGSSIEDAKCRQGYDPAIFDPLLKQNAANLNSPIQRVEYDNVSKMIVEINQCAIDQYLNTDDLKVKRKQKVNAAIAQTAQGMLNVYKSQTMSADDFARAQFMDFVYNYTNQAAYYSGIMNLNTVKINMAGIVAYNAYCDVFDYDPSIPDAFHPIKWRVASILANTSWRITKVLHRNAANNIKSGIFTLHPTELLLPVNPAEFVKDIVQMKAAEYLDDYYRNNAIKLVQYLVAGTQKSAYEYNVPTLRDAPPHLNKIMEDLRKLQQNPQAAGGGRRLMKNKQQQACKKRTSRHVKLGNRSAVVYEGPRGGKYVKVKGEFVSLAKARM